MRIHNWQIQIKLTQDKKINIPTKEQATVEQEVVKLVNAEREKAGLSPMKEDWELSRVAQYKSQDMLDKKIL